ncbi:hypothetical protein C6A37_05850 [Desulfobacteraceae bacterium SEEP-SAG9]|nr:hypothetical protein C6A37_05850 [Desulfobacteraceae bacterium SEEP-SAG9]
MLKNYKDLKVWQKSYERCLEIYRITAKLPKQERQPWIYKDALHILWFCL